MYRVICFSSLSFLYCCINFWWEAFLGVGLVFWRWRSLKKTGNDTRRMIFCFGALLKAVWCLFLCFATHCLPSCPPAHTHTSLPHCCIYRSCNLGLDAALPTWCNCLSFFYVSSFFCSSSILSVGSHNCSKAWLLFILRDVLDLAFVRLLVNIWESRGCGRHLRLVVWSTKAAAWALKAFWH